MPESKYKGEIGKILDALEKELADAKVDNNRLIAELKKLHNTYAQLVEIVQKGSELCRQLKM